MTYRSDGSALQPLEAVDTKCQWFLLCENQATMTRPHPILGNVQICQRCNDKIDKLDAQAWARDARP